MKGGQNVARMYILFSAIIAEVGVKPSCLIQKESDLFGLPSGWVWVAYPKSG